MADICPVKKMRPLSFQDIKFLFGSLVSNKSVSC